MPLSEILGYVGMAFVGVSFFFANIRILRLLNLIGATAMTVYGFMIDQPPVAILNIIIVGVNVYYLSKTSALISRFDVLSVQYQRNDAFDRFYHAHEEDIKVFFPNCSPAVLETAKIELILRDFQIVGAFAYRAYADQMAVLLDYVAPNARDMQNSTYFYTAKIPEFRARGIRKLVAEGHLPAHVNYLEEIGYTHKSGHEYEMILD